MLNFKIGDKIIYPNQGLGVIEDIQKENYFGENFKIYYVRIFANDTLVLVPSINAQEIGIRKPVSEKMIEKLFDFIRDSEVDVEMNWKGRYKEYQNLMKSGTLDEIATVLKSLFYLNLIKPLSFREKKMMEKAKELVVAEISEVAAVPSPQIEKRVFDILSTCFKNITPRIDS